MWVPASDTHAIERVAVSCIFSDHLPLKLLSSAARYADELLTTGEFSGRNDVQSASLMMGDGASVVEQPKVVGYSYLSKQNEEVLRLQTEFAHFSASQYGTWKGFVEEANRLLDPFMTTALSVTGVRHLKLEYADRFVFRGSLDDADISGVLKLADGVGVPQTALGGSMPWHDRRGWFEITDDGPMLINRNIEVGVAQHRDAPGVDMKSVQIFTIVETRFEKPIEDLDKLQKSLDSLHKTSKDVFVSVISNEAAEKIGI